MPILTKAIEGKLKRAYGRKKFLNKSELRKAGITAKQRGTAQKFGDLVEMKKNKFMLIR